MNAVLRLSVFLVTGLLTLGSIGCATGSSFNAADAQATSQAPVAAQVEEITLAFDASLPKYLVAIEPFDYSASGQISGGGQGAPIGPDAATGTTTTQISADGSTITTTSQASSAPNIGKGLAAQFTTVLSRWGNVALIDPAALAKSPDGAYTCKLQPGEIGPFIIRGTVTEFNETAEATGKKRGGSLGGVGLATGVIGAITGNRDVAAVGAGVAIADPTMGKGEAKRTGMVGMDIQIVDGRTARILGGFNSSGSFTTISKESGMSLFGIGGSNTQFAASALGQATRAALNDAVQKTANALRSAR